MTEVRRIVVRLPWPHRGLWPNTEYRNRIAKSKARAKQRGDAKYAALEALNGHRFARIFRGGRIGVSIMAYPPNPRRYDSDNLVASLKGAQDGIAEALDVNDTLFTAPVVTWGSATANGRIDVMLVALE